MRCSLLLIIDDLLVTGGLNYVEYQFPILRDQMTCSSSSESLSIKHFVSSLGEVGETVLLRERVFWPRVNDQGRVGVPILRVLKS